MSSIYRFTAAQRQGWHASSFFLPCFLLLVFLRFSAQAAAEIPLAKLDEIVVFARGEDLIGIAPAASEGAVGGADLSVRPLLRVAELLEVVPGMIAAQHSGSGKANQYFLRGFNLDHGTDFTTYIDDVPLNLRTHGHGQGYLDVNGLIPEMIERIDYRKGPYRADVGDFALAGAAYLHTVDRVAPFSAFEAGEYGWRRVAAGGTVKAGAGDLTAIGQWKTYDGPWQLPEDLNHQSLYGKYLDDTALGALEVSASLYRATWHPSEQIPERVIGSPVCEDEFCDLDSSAYGKTFRFVGSARLLGDDWRATLYAQRYVWRMSSNATYDYQINQFDRRWVYGGRYEKQWVVSQTLELSTGVEARYDDIAKVGVEHTENGRFAEPISEHAVNETSIALYSEATWRPFAPLRVLAGLRADNYWFDVDARAAGLDAGSADAQRLSPKLGLAYALTRQLELYANWGEGFHSNDARGIVNATTPVQGLVPGEGHELGLRFQTGEFSLTATYWWLDLDSELKFVGDSNSVEPGSPTERQGYELVAFWRPQPWLAIDAVWTRSHARFDQAGADDHVPGALENAGELGVTLLHGKWEASVRVRHLGEYPLREDNSERAAAEQAVNVRIAWTPGNYSLYAELLNAFDDDGKDIVYYYGTNVADFDANADQVEGRVSRAMEPRTLRAGIRYRF